MIKNTFSALENFLKSGTYALMVVIIAFTYFFLYSLSINFQLSEDFFNLFLALDNYFIFWIFFFDFVIRISDAIFRNSIKGIFTKPGNLFDISIFSLMFALSEYSYHLIWLRIIRLLYFIHLIDKVHIGLLKFRESRTFKYTNNIIIVLFALLIGIQNSFEFSKNVTAFLSFLDHLIIMYFIVEVTIKIFSYHKLLDFFYKNDKFNWWNIFDFTIIFLSILPLQELASGAVTRVLRVFRAMRTFTAFSGLRKIIKALRYSVSSIGHILLLLTVIFFIYANIGVQFFGHFTYEDGQPNLWRDLPSALLTLYRVLTFEDWTDVMYQTQTDYPIFGTLYFVSFTALTVFIFLNLFTGVIIEQIQKANSNLLKFKLNDEKYDIENGAKTYEQSNYIVIFNYNEKLPYILKELDKKAYTENKKEHIIIILNDAEKINAFEEGDCFIGHFNDLKIQFVYADILKEETHHRFDIHQAKSVIVLNQDFENSDDNSIVQTIKADNINIKIFSFLMNNKTFVLNMIHQFLSYKRMNCVIEVHTTPSAELIRSIMQETISEFTKTTDIANDKELYQLLNFDVLLYDRFKTSKKLFQERQETYKEFNYAKSFSHRDFFAIINQSLSTGYILSNAIQFFMIYKTMLELFSLDNGFIQFVKYTPNLFSKDKNMQNLTFKEAFMLYDNGLLLGYSKKENNGFIKPVINPGPNMEIPSDCYLIVYSKDTKIKSRVSYHNQTLDTFDCEDINQDRKILLIDDGTRPIEINNNQVVINGDLLNDGFSQYYEDKTLITELFEENNCIIINLEDEKSYNLTLLFLDTIRENRDRLKEKLITIFDNNVYAQLLSDSFYKFENSIVSKHLNSLFISLISQNSFSQEIINQLLFTEDSNNRFHRIKFDNEHIESMDQLKAGLLDKGYLYLASVTNKTSICINDKNYKTINEAIVISNEQLVNRSKLSNHAEEASDVRDLNTIKSEVENPLSI